MKTLTRNQCVQIAGGDPGMSLAGTGSGSGVGGGGWGNSDMALAGMGIGFQGGPPAIVSIGLPGDVALSSFDKALIGTSAGVAGGFTVALLDLALTGAVAGSVLGPGGAVVAAAGLVVAGAVGYGVTELLQHVANDGAYTDGHGLRHAAR
jgi:hypothetical protein